MLLAGRAAIVTGAAQGIGHAIATRLVAAGRQVSLLDRNPAVVDKATELGESGRGWVVDLRDVEATRSVIINQASIAAKLGPPAKPTTQRRRLPAWR